MQKSLLDERHAPIEIAEYEGEFLAFTSDKTGIIPMRMASLGYTHSAIEGLEPSRVRRLTSPQMGRVYSPLMTWSARFERSPESFPYGCID